MKFHQLQPGARFAWQGKTFRKVSPLKAACEDDDTQRLVPRSADVELLDSSGRRVGGLPAQLPGSSVQAALDDMAAACRQATDRLDPPLDAERHARLMLAIEKARTDILARLAMPGGIG